MGFCLLIAIGFDVFMTMRRKEGKKQRRVERKSCWSKIVPSQRWINVGSWIALSIILMSFSLRTLVRNQDWSSEEHLYRSGITINPAKGTFISTLSSFHRYHNFLSCLVQFSHNLLHPLFHSHFLFLSFLSPLSLISFLSLALFPLSLSLSSWR